MFLDTWTPAPVCPPRSPNCRRTRRGCGPPDGSPTGCVLGLETTATADQPEYGLKKGGVMEYSAWPRRPPRWA
ncbi:hypothetical protein AB0G32_40045 [Streptomyces sp. NPDC023723]|uniref:hypothetical protein n=1 Tax=Streptomyces sp. NPDC023723 TaxID=3154323 RepID=UPI0033EF1AC7